MIRPTENLAKTVFTGSPTVREYEPPRHLSPGHGDFEGAGVRRATVVCWRENKSLRGNFMDIGTLLPRHARYRGDHPALIVGDRRLNYRQLNACVNRLANALLRAGLRKADKFATVLPNCLERMASYWAAAKTGLVIVPMGPLLQDGGLVSLLNDSDAALVLGGACFADTFARIRGRLLGIAPDRWVLVGEEGADRPDFRTYAALVAGAADENQPE